MNMKKRKIILWILVISIIVVGVFIYRRPDIRFIIKNTWEMLGEESDFHEIPIDEKDLQSVSIGSVKDDQADIVYNNSLVLVNKDHPISEGIVPNIVDYKDTDVKMDESVADAYGELSEAVKSQVGKNLYIMDSYRSEEEQESLYSEDKNTATTPGSSEHEIGLALDVYVKFFAGEGFIKSEAGQFVYENCWKYGFIVRYPPFKKRITGMKFEPWHIRYVGLPHSEIIYKKGLTLEEYIQSLEIGKFYKSGEYIISRQKGEEFLFPNNVKKIVISPDNMGNYIITGR
ncbi:M15 family metallopeptidase [Mahella sp.]|uniref:M15 family metallopeptidase n=1 Tax=Mahella sp. TaxID=2798721 RepID=UPI0025BFB392|nr:M15 family metallopeptidase [Mahella sp.]MBZ4665585.1 peptidase and DD-carboxypeptidase VanY/endolysin [Mahella sp.]